MRRIGCDGKRKSQEAVGAHLKGDGRKNHRAAGGCLDVGIGKPSMDRPHRHLHREGHQEGQEDQDLLVQGQGQHVEISDLEAALGLVEQVDQRDKCQQRAQQRVEEELESGVDPVRAAPNPDDDVHRNQHRLKEHIEQDGVGGSEYTVDQATHDQERRQILRDAALHHLPSGHNHENGHEAVQHHEGHGDAVDAQLIADIEGRDPRAVFNELKGRGR